MKLNQLRDSIFGWREDAIRPAGKLPWSRGLLSSIGLFMIHPSNSRDPLQTIDSGGRTAWEMDHVLQ